MRHYTNRIAAFIRGMIAHTVDTETMRQHINGPRYAALLYEFDQWLRSEYKYTDHEADFFDIRQKLHEMASDEGVDING